MNRDNLVPDKTGAATWLDALMFAPDATNDHARALLTRACESVDVDVLRVAVANPRCPALALRRVTDRLLPLVKNDPAALEIMIAVAWNPNTTPRTMEKIAASKHSDLRTVLCFNPVTPESLLIALGDVATPDMGYHLATHPSSPPHLLDSLSQHPDTSVRDAVLANPRTPRATLDRLMGEAPDQIRLHAAARNASMPAGSLAEWATSNRYSVRRIVAANPNLPVHLMEQLAWTGDQRAQIAIASQPRLPEALAKALASNLTNTDTRIALAANVNLPRHIALSLLLDPSPQVRAIVISAQLGLPIQPLVHLAYEDSAPIVQAALANRADLPSSPLIRLVDGSAEGPHSSAVSAAHRTARLETDVAFALHYHEETDARMALYRRPDCPPEALAHASLDTNPHVRASVAINPASPMEMLATLSNDPDPVVALLARTHPMNALRGR